MKQINFLWRGPSGVNSVLGFVVHGKPVVVRDDDVKQDFMRQKLIEPIRKNSKNEVIEDVERDESEEKTGQTAES